MAQRCENCGRGVGYGHAVSHAKVRLKRLFKPNLQKLKVFKNGRVLRVRFCTSCIKRLKNFGHIGLFNVYKYIPKAVKEKVKKAEKVEKAEGVEKVDLPSRKAAARQGKVEKVVETAKESKAKKTPEKATGKPVKTLDISDIVGKKS
jgi:large subunit ribosomal protein L28